MTRPTTAEQVAEAVRRAVLGGRVVPGSPLREERLAAEHHVSRHTVRTALAALVAEGLAVGERYRGVRVAPVDADRVRSLQDLRRAVECEAVRLVHERHGTDWSGLLADVDATLDEMEAVTCADPVDQLAFVDVHARFHTAVVGLAASPRLTEAYRALGTELRLFMAHSSAGYGWRELTAQHRDYLADLRRRGSEAVRDHLAASERLLTSRAAQSSADAPVGPP